MEQEEWPPWVAGPDESKPTDLSKFAACDNVLSHLAAAMKEAVTDRQYTLSKQWGYILRARTILEEHGEKLTSLINCWSVDGDTVQLASMLENPGS